MLILNDANMFNQKTKKFEVEKLLIKEKNLTVYQIESITKGLRYDKKTKISVDEPEFELEPSGEDGASFILKKLDNKDSGNFVPIGLINNEGILDTSDISKRYHLSKLNLRHKHKYKQTNVDNDLESDPTDCMLYISDPIIKEVQQFYEMESKQTTVQKHKELEKNFNSETKKDYDSPFTTSRPSDASLSC